MNWRNVASNTALIGLAVAALAYLMIEIARVDPTEDPLRVTLRLPTSGGLLDTSAVTYRGVEVGKVADIRLRRDGVEVDLRIDEGIQIPTDSDAKIAGLNPAGEQYVDFRPRSDGGPFLADGAVVDDVRTPVPFAQLLSKITTLAEQIDPNQLRTVLGELSTATSGVAGDLQAIVDGGDYLLTGMESVLPETLRILRNGGTVLRTVADLRDELKRLGSSGKTIAQQLKTADPELRVLLDRSPKTLRLVDTLLADLTPDADAMLHHLSAVGATVAPRTGALRAFFPTLAEASEAIATLGGKDRLRVEVDLWPRPTCDYGNPAQPPSVGGWPEPDLGLQCEQAHPELQQRGSYNAPRPANDPTRPDRRSAITPNHDRGTEPAASDWHSRYLAMLTEAIEGS